MAKKPPKKGSKKSLKVVVTKGVTAPKAIGIQKKWIPSNF